MGVRFYDKENMSTGDDYTTITHTSCDCNACNAQTTSSSTTTTSTSATQTTNNSSCGNNLNFKKSGILREIIGNCKEVRIEDNTHNLRIVGNNNRIRMSLNVGDITVIGNNTRLKIKTNHGHIKYTGNDGRICLGKDSTEQFVDYSGCNGVLKVQNSKKPCQISDDEGEIKNNTAMGSTNMNEKFNNSKKFKEKYASYGGSRSDSEVFKHQVDYNNIYNRKRSMPNITTRLLASEKLSNNHKPLQLSKSIVNNFGNIVIANSSNICINPYSYTY